MLATCFVSLLRHAAGYSLVLSRSARLFSPSFAGVLRRMILMLRGITLPISTRLLCRPCLRESAAARYLRRRMIRRYAARQRASRRSAHTEIFASGSRHMARTREICQRRFYALRFLRRRKYSGASALPASSPVLRLISSSPFTPPCCRQRHRVTPRRLRRDMAGGVHTRSSFRHMRGDVHEGGHERAEEEAAARQYIVLIRRACEETGGRGQRARRICSACACRVAAEKEAGEGAHVEQVVVAITS